MMRPVNGRAMARVVAAGRVGFGAGLLFAPERLTSPWLGADATRGATKVVSRSVGARDVALGLGALAAGDGEVRACVGGGLLADLADLLGTATAGSALPLRGRVLVSAIASGGVVLGAITLAGLDN
jgi:hypothetical protein